MILGVKTAKMLVRENPEDFWEVLDFIKLQYLLYVFGQIGLSKECRPRSDAAERGVRRGLHCLPILFPFLVEKVLFDI